MTAFVNNDVAPGNVVRASDHNTQGANLAAVLNGNIDATNIANGAVSTAKLADEAVTAAKIKATDYVAIDGWTRVTDSWAFASSTTVTVPSDATTKYSVGDKIKFTQTSTKYFYITAVTSTVITLAGGTDFTVANAAISEIFYSKASSPHGFPQWFAWTPSWTGFSVNPTTTARFMLVGRKCTVVVRCTANGTSNATSLTITNAPVTSANVGTGMFWYAAGSGVDNGTAPTTPARVFIGNNTATIEANRDFSAANWTSSNGKAVSFALTYQV
jgi:hypothetical protein